MCHHKFQNHLLSFTLIMTQEVFHVAFPHCAHGENNGPRNTPSLELCKSVFLFVFLFLMKEGSSGLHK